MASDRFVNIVKLSDTLRFYLIIHPLYTHPWTFSAIRSMSSNCGLEINMTLAMLGGIVKVPPYSGYIFTTPYSSSKLYLATRPIGPANDWSHIIACASDKEKQIYRKCVINLFGSREEVRSQYLRAIALFQQAK